MSLCQICVCLSPGAEVCDVAAEVACLLQGEDEGAHDFVGALLVVGTMACVGFEVLYEASVSIEADAFVVALKLDGLAFAGLAFVAVILFFGRDKRRTV